MIGFICIYCNYIYIETIAFTRVVSERGSGNFDSDMIMNQRWCGMFYFQIYKLYQKPICFDQFYEKQTVS